MKKTQICTSDQRHCFHYADSTIPLLTKSEINFKLPLYRPICVAPGRKPSLYASFLTPRLKSLSLLPFRAEFE